MKKVFFAAAFAIVSFAATAGTVAPKTQRAFEDQFGTQENVTWTESAKGMNRADFTQLGRKVTAFFSRENALVATTTTLNLEDLTPKMQASIADKLGKENVTEVFRLDNEDGTTYYVGVQSGANRKVYTVGATGALSLFTVVK